MAYIITPDLGLELADPATVQPFETPNVNGNFLTLEAGIVDDRVRLAAIEGNLKRVADLDALAALSLSGVQAGTIVEVGELRALFMRNAGDTAWEQVTEARFATAAERDTAYAKAAAAFLVVGAAAFTADESASWEYADSAWQETTRCMRYFEGTVTSTTGSNFDIPSTLSGGFGTPATVGTNAIVVARAGWYRILATLDFATNNTGGRVLEVTRNAADFSRRLASRHAANSSTALSAAGIRFLNAADVIRLRGNQDSGGNLAAAGSLSVELVRGGTAPA